MPLNREVEQYLLDRLKRGDNVDYQKSIGEDYRSLADISGQNSLASNLMHAAAMTGSVSGKVPNVDWLERGNKDIIGTQTAYLKNLANERSGEESRADKVAQIYSQIMQNEEMAKQRQASEEANRAMQGFLAEKTDSRTRDIAGINDQRARELADRTSKDRMEMFKLGASSKENLESMSDKRARDLNAEKIKMYLEGLMSKEKLAGMSDRTKRDLAAQGIESKEKIAADTDTTKRNAMGMTDQRVRELAAQGLASKEKIAADSDTTKRNAMGMTDQRVRDLASQGIESKEKLAGMSAEEKQAQLDKTLAAKKEISDKAAAQRQMQLKGSVGGKAGMAKQILTPGEQAADRAYGKDYNDFTSRGEVEASSAINKLKEIKKELQAEKGLFAAGSGRASALPDALRKQQSIKMRDNAHLAANSTLKALFGGQLSDAERESAAREFYNDKLSNEDNIAILNQKIIDMTNKLTNEKAKASHFSQFGTLKGFGDKDKRSRVEIIKETNSVKDMTDEELKRELEGN